MVIDNKTLSPETTPMTNEPLPTYSMSLVDHSNNGLEHYKILVEPHTDNMDQSLSREMIALPNSDEKKTPSPVMTKGGIELDSGRSPLPGMRELVNKEKDNIQLKGQISVAEVRSEEHSIPRNEEIGTLDQKEAPNTYADTSKRMEVTSERTEATSDMKESKSIRKIVGSRRHKRETLKPKQLNKATKSAEGKANLRRAEKKKQDTVSSTKSTKKGKRGPKKHEKISTSPPPHKLIFNKVRAQVRQLTYHLHFVQAYESEGWNRKNVERLKPYESLLEAKQKVLTGKRAIVQLLGALQDLHKHDRQFDYLAPEFSHLLKSSSIDVQAPAHAENLPQYVIYCSRCNSTNTVPENDIIICDSEGCNRAYHQKCQNPPVATSDIPLGDALWYCEICEALFKCLKCINAAFETGYETADEVFPELKGEEVDARDKSSTIPQKSKTASSWLDVLRSTNDSRDDESADEDFTPKSDKGDHSEGSITNSDSDHKALWNRKTAKQTPISDDEIAYLSKENVIDSHRRSLRSSFTQGQRHNEVSKLISEHSTNSKPVHYSGQVVSSNFVARGSAHFAKSEAPSFYYKDAVSIKETSKNPSFSSVYENPGLSNTKTAFHPQIALKSPVVANPSNHHEHRFGHHALYPYSVCDASRPNSQFPVATSPTELVGTEIIKVTTLHKAKVFGLVVDFMWKVKYDDGTEEFLTWNELQCAITKTREQSTNTIQGLRVQREQAPSPSNPAAVKEKRKRSAVNYRQLNSLLFDDKADSDGEAREDISQAPSSPTTPYNETLNSQPNTSARKTIKLQRTRGRRAVNYRVMHEGSTPAAV